MRPEMFSHVVLASGVLDLTVQTAGALAIGPVTGMAEAYAGRANRLGCEGVKFLIYTGAADRLVDPANSARFAGYLDGLGYLNQTRVLPKADHAMMDQQTVAATIFKDIETWDRRSKTCARK